MTRKKAHDTNPVPIELRLGFEAVAGKPMWWQWTARELVCAANVLYREVSLARVADSNYPKRELASYSPGMLLYSYAIENLIKGLLIAKGTPATVNGELNPLLKTHCLRKLLKRAAISISESDSQFLEQLEETIASGKYPVGTGPPSGVRRSIIMPGDRRRAVRLLNMLERELRAVQQEDVLASTDLMKLCD
jgi:hypothetical protein